ncbi:MAG: MATE family efflux transporter, partial [Blautia sp.]|nr:MATE family efflux transporter [Blautia sp.]
MNDMTKGNPLSLILRFAIPLLLGNLLQQLYNVADASIVGRFLGADALAAVGATSSVQFLILGFCIGSCTGFCIPIAQKFGAKDYGALRRLIFNSAVLVLLGSVIITTVCVLLCPGILKVLSTPENIWDDTRIYILIIFLGIPFTLLYNLAAGILRAIGNSRTPFFFLAFSTIVNIFLDLFCIVILGWGCMGAAVATVASQALSGVLCTWVILKKYDILRIRREERRMEGSLVRTLLFMGVPMGLQFSITAIGSMVMQSSINGLGSAYASAFTATSRVKVFAMCPMDAIASGVATFCSQNYGAGDSGRISAGFRIGNIAGALYGALAGVLLFFFGRSACLIFLSASETQILDSCAMFLRY